MRRHRFKGIPVVSERLTSILSFGSSNVLCCIGILKSVSIIKVLNSAFAKLAAKFADTVVFPSPSPGLVIRIDFGSLILRANWTFVLKILNDSAIEDLG